MATRRDCFYGFAFAHPERDRGRIGALVTEAMRRLVDPLHTAP